MSRWIYADNAATTQMDIAAFEAMKPFLTNEYGNASQPYSFARSAKKALKESRALIAECIGASPEEIFFTSGGTESDNWAIKGSAFGDYEKRTMITSVIEHHAILRTCADVERMGYPVAYLPVDPEGLVDPQMLSDWMTDQTHLVSIMTANNEIGTIQDVAALADAAHEKGALFHTDAVQAVGHLPIDVKSLGVDMLSASAHKFNGPKGIGFLYIRSGVSICPYCSGGSQEFGMRAGTENVAGIVGMATALKNNCDQLEENRRRVIGLESVLVRMLDSSGIRYVRNGSRNRLPGLMSLSFPGADGEAILHRLDLMGIMVSTGSACDSKNTQISHVLRAIHADELYAKGTIRISFGKDNTVDEAERIADAVIKIVSRKRQN